MTEHCEFTEGEILDFFMHFSSELRILFIKNISPVFSSSGKMGRDSQHVDLKRLTTAKAYICVAVLIHDIISWL